MSGILVQWRTIISVTQSSDNEALIISYLLGELSAQEHERFEQRYLSDEDLLTEIKVLEVELIDMYVRGEISAKRRERFEKYFLNSAERISRLEFAQLFIKKNSSKTGRFLSWSASKLRLLYHRRGRRL